VNLTRPRTVHRLLLAAAGGLLATVALPAPGWAHVEVEADKAQAGARDVTLTFTGEAESASEGIVSERVVLPTGINPADVRLKKAPKGWKLTPGDGDVTVAGPALDAGEDAIFAVVVAQLPTDSTTLVFKVVESYSGGKVSRWIDVPEEGQPEPDNPAPVLKVKAAAAPAPASSGPAAPSASVEAPPSAQSPSAAPTVTSPAAAQPDDAAERSSSTGWILGGIVAVVALAAAGLLIARRRSGSARP
jgi:uncharacterized protein YcnI